MKSMKLVQAAIALSTVFCFSSFAQWLGGTSGTTGMPYIYSTNYNVRVSGPHGLTYVSGDSAVLYYGDGAASIGSKWGAGLRLNVYGFPYLMTWGENGKVGIGTGPSNSTSNPPIPSSKLQVNGSLALKVKSMAVGENYSAGDESVISLMGNSVFTLPSSQSVPGRIYYVGSWYGAAGQIKCSGSDAFMGTGATKANVGICCFLQIVAVPGNSWLIVGATPSGVTFTN
jgi:hypothetical protein